MTTFFVSFTVDPEEAPFYRELLEKWRLSSDGNLQTLAKLLARRVYNDASDNVAELHELLDHHEIFPLRGSLQAELALLQARRKLDLKLPLEERDLPLLCQLRVLERLNEAISNPQMGSTYVGKAGRTR